MSYWTFGDLKRRVREVIGRYSPLEITETEVGRAINQYYQLNFPQEALLDAMEALYVFYTKPCQQKYPIDPSVCKSFLPQAWCNDIKILFSQRLEENVFSKRLKTLNYVLGIGDGKTTTFSFSLPQLPVAPQSFIIQSETQALVDPNDSWVEGSVSLQTPPSWKQENGGGWINYSTGLGSATFITAPHVGMPITITYAPLVIGMPSTIVLYEEKFFLNPTPDKIYKIEVKGYKGLAPLVSASDLLPKEEWGLLICYGTAKNLLASYGEMEAYGEVSLLHREMLSQVRRSTQENIRIQRPRSLF